MRLNVEVDEASIGLVLSLSFRRSIGRAFAHPVLLKETFDDGRAAHFVSITVDVVPHDELVEREQSEHGFLDNIPAWLAGQLGSYGAQRTAHVDAALVFGQRLQPLQINLILLAQHLYECGVDGHLLIAATHDVVVAAATDEVDRHEQQWGVARSHALLVLIPAHQAEHHEERIGTVFFQRRARLAIEEFLDADEFVAGEVGIQAVVLDVLRDQLLELVLVDARVVYAELIGLRAFLSGHSLHGIVFTVEEMVFEHVDVEGNERDAATPHANVQQVVAQ